MGMGMGTKRRDTGGGDSFRTQTTKKTMKDNNLLSAFNDQQMIRLLHPSIGTRSKRARQRETYSPLPWTSPGHRHEVNLGLDILDDNVFLGGTHYA